MSLLYDDSKMPMGLSKELKAIQDALLKIDGKIDSADRADFYNYLLNELYDMKGEYANPDFVPKKYFEVLLEQIKAVINWGGVMPPRDV